MLDHEKQTKAFLTDEKILCLRKGKRRTENSDVSLQSLNIFMLLALRNGNVISLI